MRCAKDVVRKANEDGLKIMIGGDMNAHIWDKIHVRRRMENF